MSKYHYSVECTGGVYFKFKIDSQDAQKRLQEYIKTQNSGQPKSDRISLIDFKHMTEKNYNLLNWPEQTL